MARNYDAHFVNYNFDGFMNIKHQRVSREII